jgi:hypothetical protein
LTRLAAFIYLTVAAATSLPVSVGLLGWCPCGCLPETLGPSSESEHSDNGDSHHNDSHHCRGICTTSYCPLVADVNVAVADHTGEVEPDLEQHIPFTFNVRLIRPPRA